MGNYENEWCDKIKKQTWLQFKGKVIIHEYITNRKVIVDYPISSCHITFTTHFLCGDFRFLLAVSSLPSAPVVSMASSSPPPAAISILLLIELVAMCVPFFGGLPIRFPDALIRGILTLPPATATGGCPGCPGWAGGEESDGAAERLDATAGLAEAAGGPVAVEAGVAGGPAADKLEETFM